MSGTNSMQDFLPVHPVQTNFFGHLPEPEPHEVLWNPIVVSKIVEYLKPRDLKNSRLIEKTVWLAESTSMLKKKAIIPFDGHYDEEEEPDDKEYRDMKQYLRKLSHFQTESFCLGEGAKITECDKEYKIFFGTFGPKIKHLRIDYEYHSHFNVGVFQELLVNNLKNLEILDIRNMPLDRGNMTKFQNLLEVKNETIGGEVCLFPEGFKAPEIPSLKRIEIWNYNAYPGKLGKIFIEQLFKMGPNVSSVKIVDRFFDKIVEKCLKTIDELPDMKVNLRELVIDSSGGPTENDLILLATMNLKLKILRLGVIVGLTTPAPLQALLENQSKTLIELQFGNIKVKETMRINLPRFEKLERLELTTDIPNGAPFGFSFGRISYEKTFPKLKILVNARSQLFFPHDCWTTSQTYSRIHKTDGKKFFTGMEPLWKELFPEDGIPCNTLVNLDIPYPSKRTGNENFFLRLAKMFPEANNEFLKRLREGMKIERPGYGVHEGKWTRSVDLLVEAIRLDDLTGIPGAGLPMLDNPSLKRDYGFGNCISQYEVNFLLNVYYDIIKKLNVDLNLNKLHEACISGKLAGFITELYKIIGRPGEKVPNLEQFSKNLHLVNNPYPIPIQN